MPKFRRSDAILKVYRNYTRPLVDREVMNELGFNDPNTVRPRITEMISKNILKQVDTRRDGITGKLVRLVTVSGPRRTMGLYGITE